MSGTIDQKIDEVIEQIGDSKPIYEEVQIIIAADETSKATGGKE